MRRATVQILELPPHAFPSLACPCESCVSLSIITEPHHSLPTRSWHVEAVLVPWPLPHRRSQQANLSSKWVFLLSPDTDKLHLPFDSWLIYWFVTRSGRLHWCSCAVVTFLRRVDFRACFGTRRCGGMCEEGFRGLGLGLADAWLVTNWMISLRSDCASRNWRFGSAQLVMSWSRIVGLLELKRSCPD